MFYGCIIKNCKIRMVSLLVINSKLSLNLEVDSLHFIFKKNLLI